MNTQTLMWCDACGDVLDKASMYHYQTLPKSVCNVNQGESASLCSDCNSIMEQKLEGDMWNHYFLGNHR